MLVGGDDPVIGAADQFVQEIGSTPQLPGGGFDLAFQIVGVFTQLSPDIDLFLGALECDRQGIVADRLVDEIGRPEVQRLDGVGDIAVPGDDDDFGVCIHALDAFKHLDPVHSGHLDVRDHDFGALPFERGDAIRAAFFRGNRIAVGFQRTGQHSQNVRFVVDEKNSGHGGSILFSGLRGTSAGRWCPGPVRIRLRSGPRSP